MQALAGGNQADHRDARIDDRLWMITAGTAVVSSAVTAALLLYGFNRSGNNSKTKASLPLRQQLDYHIKSLALRLSGVERKIIVLLPASDRHISENEEEKEHLVPPSLSNLSTASSRSTFSGSEGSMQNSNHPPVTTNSSSGIPRGIDTTQEQTWSLMIILPGANMAPEAYYAVATTIQQQAWKKFHTKLVVAIGLDMEKEVLRNRLARWVLNDGDPRMLVNLVQARAEQRLVQQQQKYGFFLGASYSPTSTQVMEQLYNVHGACSVFQDIFLFGHSMGGLTAIISAYPSKFRALMTYGCSMTYAKTLPLPQSQNLLPSYPKPALTIIGERDGNMRCYLVSEEAEALEIDIRRKIQCSRGQPADIKRVSRLHKPIVVLSELNHMQMANDILPAESRETGRMDFASRVLLAEAHSILARVVVDFMHVHSSLHGYGSLTLSNKKKSMVSPLSPHQELNNPSTESTGGRSRSSSITESKSATVRAQDRLLKLAKMTDEVYLKPWLLISDRVHQSRFICDIQRQVLHITTGSNEANFYEDDTHEDSGYEEHTTPDMIPNWHIQSNDFLYAKSRWDSDCDQILLEIVEQDPISVSFVKQLSKTLAFKGRSREDILFNQNKYQEIKDSPAPTLMEINRQTFSQVLNHMVTPQQRRRYLQDGKKLRFGPDIFVQHPPAWVTTPLSITKQGGNDIVSKWSPSSKSATATTDDRDAYYLLQSPYVTTPTSKPAPFGGAWYGKPLSPAQAYEWIVFDAFKPFL